MSHNLIFIENEQIIAELRLSNDIFILVILGLPLIIVGIIFPVLLLPLIIIGIVLPILYFRHYNFYITNKRVVHQKGIFFIDEEEMRFEKIESVQIKNSFGSKNLILQGTGGYQMEIEWVGNATELKNSIYTIIDSKK